MSANANEKSLLLKSARIVLAERVIERGALFIKKGRIARILEGDHSSFAGDDPSAVELEGLTLFPGFIDAHIHGSAGVDTMEATADDLHMVARFLAGHGVTGWLPTLVPAPPADYSKATQAIAQLMREENSRTAAARCLGVHYEGPFVNSAQCGALRPAYFRTFEATASLDELARVDKDEAAHMMTIAPEIAGGIALIAELGRRGWIVSIGHTRAAPSVLDAACEAGARHMTHFMNAMSPLHQRAPGPIGWGLLRDDIGVDVIADGVHVDPLALRLVLRCKSPARVSLISDAVAPTGLGDGEYQIWGETISVANGRTQNARGQIAGSVSTMLDAVRMMLSLGLKETEVARMASRNPARLLRADGDCGSIEEGKRADLTALDVEGNVRLTLVGGRIAYDESAS